VGHICLSPRHTHPAPSQSRPSPALCSTFSASGRRHPSCTELRSPCARRLEPLEGEPPRPPRSPSMDDDAAAWNALLPRRARRSGSMKRWRSPSMASSSNSSYAPLISRGLAAARAAPEGARWAAAAARRAPAANAERSAGGLVGEEMGVASITVLPPIEARCTEVALSPSSQQVGSSASPDLTACLPWRYASKLFDMNRLKKIQLQDQTICLRLSEATGRRAGRRSPRLHHPATTGDARRQLVCRKRKPGSGVGS
jgi:hypothetical protein